MKGSITRNIGSIAKIPELSWLGKQATYEYSAADVVTQALRVC